MKRLQVRSSSHCLSDSHARRRDTAEKRFERVGHNMMCVCGCGQILLECNHVGCPDSDVCATQAQVSGNGANPTDGGARVAASATGGSDKRDPRLVRREVRSYRSRLAHLRGGFDNVAWITPIALFLAAILGTALIIRIWKSRTAAARSR